MWFTTPLILSIVCYNLASLSVVNITRETFAELVENTPNMWLINFCSYGNKECRNALSEFLEASRILERYLKLGFVDVDQEVILTYTFGASNVPRILLFGYDKSHPKEFEGFKTVRGFTTAALKIVEDDVNEQIKNRFVNQKTVHELDEYSLKKLLSANVEHKGWCVVKYSSECHDCLKFSDIFKRLSEYFKHSFNFGAIDVLRHSHDLDKYPHVRYYMAESAVENYAGELTYNNLKGWLLNMLPDPLVLQLTSWKMLEKTCKFAKYCLVVALPSLEPRNSTYRTNLFDELSRKAKESKHLSVAWIWFEIGEQIHLQRLLNISDTTLSAFTIVHVKKLIYHQMIQYNTDDNDELLAKLLGHAMDETELNGVIETKEFPKIFKVSQWHATVTEDIKIKTEL